MRNVFKPNLLLNRLSPNLVRETILSNVAVLNVERFSEARIFLLVDVWEIFFTVRVGGMKINWSFSEVFLFFFIFRAFFFFKSTEKTVKLVR